MQTLRLIRRPFPGVKRVCFNKFQKNLNKTRVYASFPCSGIFSPSYFSSSSKENEDLGVAVLFNQEKNPWELKFVSVISMTQVAYWSWVSSELFQDDIFTAADRAAQRAADVAEGVPPVTPPQQLLPDFLTHPGWTACGVVLSFGMVFASYTLSKNLVGRISYDKRTREWFVQTFGFFGMGLSKSVRKFAYDELSIPLNRRLSSNDKYIAIDIKGKRAKLLVDRSQSFPQGIEHLVQLLGGPSMSQMDKKVENLEKFAFRSPDEEKKLAAAASKDRGYKSRKKRSVSTRRKGRRTVYDHAAFPGTVSQKNRPPRVRPVRGSRTKKK